jgi:hypothetical protein
VVATELNIGKVQEGEVRRCHSLGDCSGRSNGLHDVEPALSTRADCQAVGRAVEGVPSRLGGTPSSFSRYRTEKMVSSTRHSMAPLTTRPTGCSITGDLTLRPPPLEDDDAPRPEGHLSKSGSELNHPWHSKPPGGPFPGSSSLALKDLTDPKAVGKAMDQFLATYGFGAALS